MTIQTSSDLDDLRDLVRHYASLGNSQAIVWLVFISRIRCAIKAGIRSVAEQKLKQSKLMLSGFFHFFFHE